MQVSVLHFLLVELPVEIPVELASVLVMSQVPVEDNRLILLGYWVKQVAMEFLYFIPLMVRRALNALVSFAS